MDSRRSRRKVSQLDAFDSDVVILAASPNVELGKGVAQLINAPQTPNRPAGIGSVLLLPETLSKPWREQQHSEMKAIVELLARLRLFPFGEDTALLALSLAAAYRLQAADAAHLATAVGAGADRFITNNSRDFPKRIEEIEIVYPSELPAS